MINKKLSLFWEEDLEALEIESVRILKEACKGGAMLSLSGGMESEQMFTMAKKHNIPFTHFFTNSSVEPVGNRKRIKEYAKTLIKVEPKPFMNYKEIVHKYGFAIGNKELSGQCSRLYRAEVKESNIADKYRVVTGISPYKLDTKTSLLHQLPLKYYHMAKTYPIQQDCCRILKKEPAKKVKTPMVVGITADDSPQRRRAIENAYSGKYFPLKSWTKATTKLWLEKNNATLSSEYHDKVIDENTTVIGAINTGCTGCHFGQTQNHYMFKNGKIEKTTKFENLALKAPKAHAYHLEMKHSTGVTFREVINCFDKSKRGEFMKESIIARNEMIEDIITLAVLSTDAIDKLSEFWIDTTEIKDVEIVTLFT